MGDEECLKSEAPAHSAAGAHFISSLSDFLLSPHKMHCLRSDREGGQLTIFDMIQSLTC